MLKLGKLSKILKAIAYKDTLDVYRLSIQQNKSFTYENTESTEPLYKAIPCKISNNFKDLPEEDSYLINPTNQHISVFCEPHWDIRKGDKLVLHRLDDNGNEVETFTQYAGKPNKEINHQEISLMDRTYA